MPKDEAQGMILPSQGMIDSSELARLTCIYCDVTLSDAESAGGGKVCETCAADNDVYQGPEFQYYPADDEYDEDDEMVEAEMNCGMNSDGQCSQAGTEYCDWNCPFSR